VAADSLGEKVGEGEEVAAELTVGSIWAEKGRERELDGEGRSSAERQWRTAVCGLDSAGGGLNRARGWSEEVRGEVERLGVRRIEMGWRGMASARSGGGTARALGDDKLELERRRGAMADAWRRSPAARRRYGVGAAQ